MSVNDKFDRILQYSCDMYIEHKVPGLATQPTAEECVDYVMKQAKIKVLDIGDISYKRLIKRAKKQLALLP